MARHWVFILIDTYQTSIERYLKWRDPHAFKISLESTVEEMGTMTRCTRKQSEPIAWHFIQLKTQNEIAFMTEYCVVVNISFLF